MTSRITAPLITFILASVLTAASPLHQPLPIPGSAPRVDLNYTRYLGTRLSNGVSAFLGMRYAAAPVGGLRWRAPIEPPRSAVRCEPALKFRPSCLGNAVSLLDLTQDEDCLFVNVWTSSNATANSKLPVWVFVQGGGVFEQLTCSVHRR
jgi:hypothetical protein